MGAILSASDKQLNGKLVFPGVLMLDPVGQRSVDSGVCGVLVARPPLTRSHVVVDTSAGSELSHPREFLRYHFAISELCRSEL